MENKAYHHGDLRVALVRAGLDILDKEGYQALSLRKVAKACQVSQTAPYRHFRDKDELVSAIGIEAMSAFDAVLRQAESLHPGKPGEQMKAMGNAYVRFFLEHPEYLRLLFLGDLRTIIKRTPPFVEGWESPSHPFDTFFRVIQRLQTTPAGGGMGQEELMLYCWGLVHGIAVLLVSGEYTTQTDALRLTENIMNKYWPWISSQLEQPKK